MGPKPHEEYDIEYQISPVPTLTDYWLYVCEDTDCLQYQELGEIYWGYFECTQTECSSWTSADHFYIELGFDDSTTRQSNAVTKRFFYSKFRITVLEDELILKEVGGTPNPIIIALVCFVIFIILLVGLIIWLIVRWVRKAKPSTEKPKH
jgi:hypothetical protein